ncbi:MAG: hypothetical protein JWM59_4755 [Verrucomicrobiales bacterium]|nr:hypothetical protein [Verrucomicrobiales bacterium]
MKLISTFGRMKPASAAHSGQCRKNQHGLGQGAGQRSRQIHCSEEQKFPQRGVASGSEDPLHIQPGGERIGEHERDGGGGKTMDSLSW